jgi:hypothetical protein
MRLFRFLVGQGLLLGTGAFVLWAVLGTGGRWPLRLSLDTASALALGVVLTSAFLVVVALPLQCLVRPLPARLAAGALSGPLGVWLGLLVLSSYPVGWEWYVTRAWILHFVYAIVGVVFGWAWWAKLRPNNSSKPTPLRGAA